MDKWLVNINRARTRRLQDEIDALIRSIHARSQSAIEPPHRNYKISAAVLDTLWYE